MYTSYQIKSVRFVNPERWLARGQQLESENSRQIRDSLETFVTPTGEIDASKMMQEWFSDISADVFISHSRADTGLALQMSGWLFEVFGLTSFVDSCVWGYGNDLLRQIDDACCYQNISKTYSYEKRNITTSHLHLMLGTALTQMIDRCECLFFLNTKNSLKSVSVEHMTTSDEECLTQSPWLFHELAMMQLIRRKEIDKHRLGRVKQANLAENITVLPPFNYPVNLTDVQVLQADELNLWEENWNDHEITDHYALDFLYDVKSPLL